MFSRSCPLIHFTTEMMRFTLSPLPIAGFLTSLLLPLAATGFSWLRLWDGWDICDTSFLVVERSGNDGERDLGGCDGFKQSVRRYLNVVFGYKKYF